MQCSERKGKLVAVMAGVGGGTNLRSQKVGAPTGNVGKIIPEEGKVTWVLEPTWVQILTLLL